MDYFKKKTKFSFLSDFLKTIFVFCVATLLAFLLVGASDIKDNIFGIYILSVAIISVITSGYFWGIVSSFLGIFSVNYFFTYPYYAFNFLLAGYPLTFLSMLVISTIISTLAVKIKDQAIVSAMREKQAEALHDITKQLLATTGMENIRTLALEYFSNAYACSTILYWGAPTEKNYTIKNSSNAHKTIFETEIEYKAACLCETSHSITGAGTSLCPQAMGTYIPIQTKTSVFGVLGLLLETEQLREPQSLDFLGIMTSQLILAIERQNLFEQQQKILVETEKEKMRSNLLRAVSHDLRTPLTGILGSATIQLDHRDTLTKQESDKLMLDIIQDAQWLIHMIENLLAITRISNQQAVIKKQLEAPEEVIAETISKIKKRFPQCQIQAKVPDDFALVPMDATLIVQVLINLVENAIRHSHSTKPILLQLIYEKDNAIFSVTDHGIGLPPESIDTIFNGILSEKLNDSTRGLGIGLSICNSIISAHHGNITAENNKAGGATFHFSLPMKGDTEHGK